MAVVPPHGAVVGGAVDDGVANVGREQPSLDKLHQVVIAQPRAEHARVLGLGERRADANADGLDAVAIEVETGYILAVALGQPVVAVGAARRVGVDALVLAVEANGVVGAGEDDALHAMLACGLVNMEHAADVWSEDVFEGMLGGHTAEVDDGINAVNQRMYRSLVGQVAGNYLFMRA
ncbi:hypothetical protein D3C81_1723200 [compost metagenome]